MANLIFLTLQIAYKFSRTFNWIPHAILTCLLHVLLSHVPKLQMNAFQVGPSARHIIAYGRLLRCCTQLSNVWRSQISA